VRGLVEQGGGKSLRPTLFRLGEDGGRYGSVQQFLVDSRWDSALLIRAGAERIVPGLGLVAWVVDDTGVKKDGEHSPGVKRQWSGTLGKVDNCQVTVSVHAVGERGRCRSAGRSTCSRNGALTCPGGARPRSPTRSRFRRSRAWPSPSAGRRPRGRSRRLRSWPTAPTATTAASAVELHGQELEYVLAVSAQVSVYGPETSFAVPERNGTTGRPRTVARPDRKPESVRALAERLPSEAFETIVCRTTPAGEEVESGFAFVRVVATHPSAPTTSRPGSSG
jgi:DDE superfamily endonuclease